MEKRMVAGVFLMEVENIASYKVLKRCGFKKYKEERTHWWRINKRIS
jgi:RimJ/RimL family protein N-acetyltransferase